MDAPPRARLATFLVRSASYSKYSSINKSLTFLVYYDNPVHLLFHFTFFHYYELISHNVP